MRKKIIGGLAISAIAVLVAVNVTIGSTGNLSDLKLNSIEALGQESSISIKVYGDSSGSCSEPCIKTWRSCPKGSDLEDCSASDCC